MNVLICCNPTRKRNRRRLDKKLYRKHYRVECLFHDLKCFRAIASRHDRDSRLAVVKDHAERIACAPM